MEILVEIDVTSTGCVAFGRLLLRIALSWCVVLCCDVMVCDLSLTCYSSLLD